MIRSAIMNTASEELIASPDTVSPVLSDEALCARVATMRRQMLTVCAWTQRINYEGEWITPDVFLRRCFQIPVTHGIEPAALKRALGELSEPAATTGRDDWGATPSTDSRAPSRSVHRTS